MANWESKTVSEVVTKITDSQSVDVKQVVA